MKSMGIARIEVDSPMLAMYVKTIKTWNNAQEFKMNNNHLYALYLDNLFCGASVMNLNKEKTGVDILMINNGNKNYNQEESVQKLTDIALSEYNVAKVKVNCIK